MDANELGIPNVEVWLTPAAGADLGGGLGIPITTTTSPTGTYLFDDLPMGAYTVTVDTSALPNDKLITATGDPDGGGDSISATTLTANEPDDLDQDFGYAPFGSIGDKIWHDTNGNGLEDGNELGIGNLVVSLMPPAAVDLGNGLGVPITTTTDGSGMYLFSSLPLDTYTVTVDTSGLPSNKRLSPTADPDGGADSKSVVTISLDDPDTEENEQNNRDQDFAYQPFGSIGDTVWHDTNGDGIQDQSELGIGNVEVWLTPPAGTDLGNGLGVPITATTDSTGVYLFDGLPLGQTYTVTVDTSTLPGNKLTSATGDPDGGADSTSQVNLPYDDPNTEEDETSDRSQDFGYEPFGSIGDTIWHDDNGDGVQDQGELGIGNLVVSLTPATGVDLGNGSGIPITATTDSTGLYLFDNLPLNTYTVTVDTSGLPADKLTRPTADPDGGEDSKSVVTIAVDNLDTEENEQNNRDQDFAYQPFGSIGDTIWHDTNGDGVQDQGELGIPNLVVSLTPAAAVDLGSGPGVAITNTTDSTGMYLFANLPLGDYAVTVDTSDSTSMVTLTPDSPDNRDQDFAYQPSGSVGDTIWHDTNSDGIQDSGEAGIEGLIMTLTDSSGNVMNSTSMVTLTPDSPDNRDQDFAYEPVGSIGDTIFHDANSDGVMNTTDGDFPLSGVDVILTDANGNLIASATTDANGNYLFDNLPLGDYVVTVDTSTLPASKLTDPTGDPDSGPGGIGDSTSAVSLTPENPSTMLMAMASTIRMQVTCRWRMSQSR